MKEEITKIETSRKGARQDVKHSKDLYVGGILYIDYLKKHSFLALPSPLNFKVKKVKKIPGCK